MLLPEASASNGNTGLETTGPRLDYNISFSTPGTYRVRVNMAKQSSDLTAASVLVGKNGQCISCRGTGMNANNEKFVWQGNADGTLVEFEVKEAGVQTFNLWMRKDGTAVNKIHLTTLETNAGINAVESTRNSCGTIANAINCVDFNTNNLELNDRVGTGVYEANNSIESAAQIAINNEVLMQATDSVIMKAGFHAENGTVFTARLRASCPTVLSNRNESPEQRSVSLSADSNKLLCYPNPFNEITTLNYSLAKISDVRILIYNMTGDLIHTLLDTKSQDTGVYQISFDASSQVSGMYVAIMEVNGVNVQQQLLVVE